jgi:hypothetical protein
MKRRPSIGLAVSIGVHVVVIVALARITFGSYGLLGFFDRDSVPLPVERIGFISLPDRGVEDTPGQRGGDGRAITRPVEPPPPLVAPARTPIALPPVNLTRPERDAGGRGPLVGGGGPLRGIQPSYSDPRLWTRAGDAVVAPARPKTMAELVDSSIVATVRAYLDSMAALPRERAPGDWTFDRGGKTWGIDREFIRLGDFQIPTAVLAMLPLNVQGNPTTLDRERRFAQMRADIDWQARVGEADLEFNKAVKRIRERYLRERREREAGGSPP